MNIEKLFSGMPVLESERLILKEVGKNSVGEVFRIYDNDRVFQYCGIIPKHNRQTVENMIGHFHRDYVKRKNMKLGIYWKSDNSLHGIIEVMDIKKKVDMVTLGYFLAEESWGNGIATEAVGVFVKYLFDEIYVNRIHGEVMVENEASKRVLMKSGFSKEGTIREGAFWPGKGIVDLEVYGYLKRDYKGLNGK